MSDEQVTLAAIEMAVEAGDTLEVIGLACRLAAEEREACCRDVCVDCHQGNRPTPTCNGEFLHWEDSVPSRCGATAIRQRSNTVLPGTNEPLSPETE